MHLSFKTVSHWGWKTSFPEKILGGLKLHTIRQGTRFSVGVRLHMATGMRTKNYNCFNADRGDCQQCLGVQRILVEPKQKEIYIWDGMDFRKMTWVEVDRLAKNDGFDNTWQFWKWFTEPVNGQLVHWTNLLY